MQALALKYRPKNYNQLIGQEVVAQSLSHALDSKRLGHAYLFSGIRGSGKTSSARIFAKALICENGPTSHPCETCQNCIAANEGRHLDIIEMDAASHRKIDDIRELIEHTKYSPASARFKIFIIDEVHMLTKEAFNALLKTLEEPPEYVKFILATTDPLKLPATVLSRTQHFRFKPISKIDVVNHLEFILKNENINYEKDAIEILARSGGGSLRDTITLLDQAIIFCKENITKNKVADMLGILDPAKIEEIFEVIISQDRNRALKLIKEIEHYEASAIIDELSIYLKDLFLQNKKFSLLMFERFFKILSQIRVSANSNLDNGFLLSVAIFLMMEAVNLKIIDEAIHEIQPVAIPNNNRLQTSNDNNIQKNNIQLKSNFEILLDKIYDRNYELGMCFSQNVTFESFDDNVLKLKSKAVNNDAIMLNKNYQIIKLLVSQIFTPETKISITKLLANDIKNNTKADNKHLTTSKNQIDSDLDEILNIATTDISSDSDIEKQKEILKQIKTENKMDKKDIEALKISEFKRLYGNPIEG